MTPPINSPIKYRTDKEIVEWVLGHTLDENNCTPYCPGWHCHTSATGDNALMVFFDDEGNFTGFKCHHQSCKFHRTMFYHAVASRIKLEREAAKKHLKLDMTEPARPWRTLGASPHLKSNIGMSTLPKTHLSTEEIQRRAQQVADRCPIKVTPDLLRSVSPIAIPSKLQECPALMLDTLYLKGEHILIFNQAQSFGNYEYVVGNGFYELSQRPGDERRQKLDYLPLLSREGMTFLTAPVTGKWEANPLKEKLGRAHKGACTRFPYLLIESDSIDTATWLKILVQQRIPIACVCTSGSKSIHALLRLDEAANWKDECAKYRYLINLGADKNAMTMHRRSRLPGIFRPRKEAPGSGLIQQLLYLDSNAGRSEGQSTTILERIQTLANYKHNHINHQTNQDV